MNRECPNCGSYNTCTKNITEMLCNIEVTFPIRVCNDCNFNYIDQEGMNVRNKTIKCEKTKFVLTRK